MLNDREKMIELMEKGHREYFNRCSGMDKPFIVFIADYLFANGATVQRWIPVSERLPEDDLPKDSKSKQIKVLVAYMSNGSWVVRTNLRKKGRWYGEPERWDWSVSVPITHWMPLPDAPKDGE